jgi:hypothetical protein
MKVKPHKVINCNLTHPMNIPVIPHQFTTVVLEMDSMATNCHVNITFRGSYNVTNSPQEIALHKENSRVDGESSKTNMYNIKIFHVDNVCHHSNKTIWFRFHVFNHLRHHMNIKVGTVNEIRRLEEEFVSTVIPQGRYRTDFKKLFDFLCVNINILIGNGLTKLLLPLTVHISVF